MDQPGLVQEAETAQKLLCKDANESGAQPPELVLLDQLVQVDAKQLEDETEMLSVDEGILQSEQVMIVVFVELAVQLRKG